MMMGDYGRDSSATVRQQTEDGCSCKAGRREGFVKETAKQDAVIAGNVSLIFPWQLCLPCVPRARTGTLGRRPTQWQVDN